MLGLKLALTPFQLPVLPKQPSGLGCRSPTPELIYGAFEHCFYHQAPWLGILFTHADYSRVEIAAQPQPHLGPRNACGPCLPSLPPHCLPCKLSNVKPSKKELEESFWFFLYRKYSKEKVLNLCFKKNDQDLQLCCVSRMTVV